MARLVATASLAVLLLSLLSVANSRVLETEPDTDGDGASFFVALPDEQGTSKSAVSQEEDATEVVLPTVAAGEGFLRLPSHRRHHQPCRHGLLHRHLWWARHHGLFHRHGGFPGPGEAPANPAAVVLPNELSHDDESSQAEKEEEVKAVAEPDPDSHLDTDGEHEVEEETKKPFHGEEEEDNEMMKAWKREMFRTFNHGLRFHHRHHLRHHHEEEVDDQEQDKEGAGTMKRLFHFHHHHDDEEEMTRKPFHHDSDNEDENKEEEEIARHWRKAIMRRRFRHGRSHHHHAEDAENEEEGGVMKWFRDLMNRF